MARQCRYSHRIDGLDLHFEKDDMDIFAPKHEEANILRSLALTVAELANRPIEQKKRQLWLSHNSLQPTRPVIFCDPENGWHEIITEKDLLCSSYPARQWEFNLRKEIFWGKEMQDDRVIDNHFNVPYIFENTGWGVNETKIGGDHGGAYTWKSPLTSLDYNELEKLKYPEIIIDEKATQHMLDIANEVFDNILKVRLKCNQWWWTLGLTQDAVKLRGLSELMCEMYDNPEGMHNFMAFLRDGTLKMLDHLEAGDLLSLNNDSDYVGSGGFGFTKELPQAGFNGSHVSTRDMWGFCESQETCHVSPVMFEEFIFPYQLPIMERFGLNCYGCCEPLDKRWHVIKQIPRLRRVSVSPWADVTAMSEQLGDRYIFSLKPNPATLAVSPLDEEQIRKELRSAIQLTKNCHLEIIMKDNNTICGNPQHVIRWVEIVREEAESFL